MLQLIIAMVCITALVSFVANLMAQYMRNLQPVRARAQAKPKRGHIQRLRQDPRTGIYYPET